MRDWLAGLVGENLAEPLSWLLALAVVIGLALVLIGLAKRVFAGTGGMSGRNRAPRLAVLDVAPVDPKRKLVLVRRDDTEHLILIGGQNDLVVEQGITRGQSARRSGGPLRQEPELGTERASQPMPQRRVPPAPPQQTLPQTAAEPLPALGPETVAPEVPAPVQASRSQHELPVSSVRKEPELFVPTRSEPASGIATTPAPTPMAMPVISPLVAPPAGSMSQPKIQEPPSSSSEAPHEEREDGATRRREPAAFVPPVEIERPRQASSVPAPVAQAPAAPMPSQTPAQKSASEQKLVQPTKTELSLAETRETSVTTQQGQNAAVGPAGSAVQPRSMATPTLPPVLKPTAPNESTEDAGRPPQPAVTRSLWAPAPPAYQPPKVAVATPVVPPRAPAEVTVSPAPASSVRVPQPAVAAPASERPAVSTEAEGTEPKQPLSVRSFATTIQSRRTTPLPVPPPPVEPSAQASPLNEASQPRSAESRPYEEIQPVLSNAVGTEPAAARAEDKMPAMPPAGEKPSSSQTQPARTLTLEEEMERLLHDFTLDVSDRRQ